MGQRMCVSCRPRNEASVSVHVRPHLGAGEKGRLGSFESHWETEEQRGDGEGKSRGKTGSNWYS